MQESTTRERLLAAATALFAEHGFQGAAVRDICNQARVNPGAVSYHFGGKRQLYRAVLRSAVAVLAHPVTDQGEDDSPQDLTEVYLSLERSVRERPQLSRLILRDLADGGQMALEALAPALRGLRSTVADAIEAGEGPSGHRMVNRLILQLASPIVLAGAAWPVLTRVLQLDEDDLAELTADAAAKLRRSSNLHDSDF